MWRRVTDTRPLIDSIAIPFEYAQPKDERIWRAKILAALAILRQIIWPDRLSAGVTERLHLRYCIAASALIFLVCSIFSVGFHNPDEYFQTVEFASAKLSATDTGNLPWEYREEMRSWLQPAIYVGVSRAAEYLGVERPLTQLFLFRLITAVIAYSSLWMLVVAGRHWIAGEIDRRRLYSIAAFLWLLPFLGARTSSESLATSALCCGIALMEWRTSLLDRKGRFALAALAGMALGLCFEFRFANGIMAAGAGLWYLRPAYRRPALLAGLALGALSALALGALADWWGYGHLSFPAYSYFYQNFVLGRASRDFGASASFAYLYLPLLESGAILPLVFTLLVATLTAWLARPFSVLTWASAPYVVLLCVAAHKEARFLFPLIPFLPFFVIFALGSESAVGARLHSFVRWLLSDWRLKFAYALNFCGLLGVTLLPQAANFPLYELMEKISFAADAPIEAIVIRAPGKMPYGVGEGHMAFLEPKNLYWISNPSVAQLELKQSRGEAFLAFVNIPVQSAESAAWIRGRCAFVWSTWPQWLQPYDYFGWQERSAWWMLYRCDNGRKSFAAAAAIADSR